MSRHSLLLLFASTCVVVHGQEWMPCAPFGGSARADAAAFSVDGRGYIATGTEFPNPGGPITSMWAYEPSGNVWTQRADLPVIGRQGCVGFSLGHKGYLCAGVNYLNSLSLNELWEYDPASDTWTDMAPLPALGRRGGVAFTIGGYAYVGFGTHWNNFLNDLWRYDQTTDSWAQMASLPDGGRAGAVGFSANGKGYVATGANDSLSLGYHDLWEYDPTTDSWTEKAPMPTQNRWAAVGFSLGDQGYVGLGRGPGEYVMYNFWRYDPVANTWTAVDDFGGGARYASVAFTIDQIGYAGTGWSEPGPVYQDDLWAYDPSAADGILASTLAGGFKVYPQPATDVLHFTSSLAGRVEVFDNMGRVVLNSPIAFGASTLPIGSLAPGVFTMVLRSAEAARRARFVKE